MGVPARAASRSPGTRLGNTVSIVVVKTDSGYAPSPTSWHWHDRRDVLQLKWREGGPPPFRSSCCMSRLALPLVGLSVAWACATATAAPRGSTTYTFGRTAGNIEPFTVSIADDGSVLANGHVRNANTATGLAHVAAVLPAPPFGMVTPTMPCPGALPRLCILLRHQAERHVNTHGARARRLQRTLQRGVEGARGRRVTAIRTARPPREEVPRASDRARWDDRSHRRHRTSSLGCRGRRHDEEGGVVQRQRFDHALRTIQREADSGRGHIPAPVGPRV